MRLRHAVSIAAVMTLVLSGAVLAEKAEPDDKLGLEKSSVFDTPDPIVPGTDAKMPGENQPAEGYFPGSPPMVPHRIEDFVPITIGENACLDCHSQPENVGKKVPEGEPTPMPATHFTDLRRAPNKVTGKPIGARFVCTQCHAPQTDAKPLVGNTYKQ